MVSCFSSEVFRLSAYKLFPFERQSSSFKNSVTFRFYSIVSLRCCFVLAYRINHQIFQALNYGLVISIITYTPDPPAFL
ncbi:hypothetical protein CS542_00240 [Pedobacter sp. IW39]|nr:hypothetical protein CS542_00240 [Pedobacter sp. IW39]